MNFSMKLTHQGPMLSSLCYFFLKIFLQYLLYNPID